MPQPKPKQIARSSATPGAPQKRLISGMGWRPDTPDARDHVFSVARAKVSHGVKKVTVASKVDLRTSGFLPAPYDQGQLGSCTANAIGGAYEYEQKRQGLSDFMPSRLFIYYGEREIEGTIPQDAGAEIRDGMKVAATLGVPHETLWPYDEKRFAVKPPKKAYTDAKKHQCLTYARVDVSPMGIKTALSALTPVVLGFSVYQSFEDVGSDGLVPIPNIKKEKMLGGHAVLCVGYQNMKGANRKAADHAIIRNSWGSDWADGGYCYMPLAWLATTTHADDFWAIQSVEG
jgi:C1A family cysteine protease